MTRSEYYSRYTKYEIKRKEEKVTCLPNKYYLADEVEGPKINAIAFQHNAIAECYRELLVSHMPIIPLLEKQVYFKEADYLLYTHPYARCDDMSDVVCNDLRKIASCRKDGAEIIVVGKAANAEKLLNGEISNITFVGDHYAEYLGKRFGLPDMKEQYVVYDDYWDQLNIWPVDGCNNKCAFCRRSYMYIRFESQKFTFIKKQLDWYQENEPQKMRHISLRAENLTEYGIDLYGRPMLHRIISLINSYPAVKSITIDIGMCIGEITPEIQDALCQANKLTRIGLNPEVGSDRLLKFVGKKHTCQQAINVCTALRNANPKLIIESTIMVGLPTETIEDMYLLADLLHKIWPDYIHLNYYIHSPRTPLNQYPQMSESLREYHLQILLKQLRRLKKKYAYTKLHPSLYIRHYFIWGKKRNSRKWIKEKIKLDKENQETNLLPINMPFEKIVYTWEKIEKPITWRDYE